VKPFQRPLRVPPILLIFAFFAGCATLRPGSGTPTEVQHESTPAIAASVERSTPAVQTAERRTAPPASRERAGGCEDVLAFRDGEATRTCAADAEERGLTIVDLSDRWTPGIFVEAPEFGDAGRQPYRATFLALADERFEDDAEFDQAREDHYLELYGIFPTFRVLRARLLDAQRHRCHDAVDDEAIAALTTTLRPFRETPDEARARIRQSEHLYRHLETARENAGLATLAELAASDPAFGLQVRRYQEMRTPIDAIKAVQAHLRCDDLLEDDAVEGMLDRATVRSLKQWQRKHMIISWGLLDEETRVAMRHDSRELDYRSVLRALRERVVDATGIIEDGSAREDDFGIILGRHVDPEEIHAVRRYGTLPHGAPDLISPATEAAARALGWTGPAETIAAFERMEPAATRSLVTALPLPEPPRYHDEHMELRAEIERGDVWYAYPYQADGTRRGQPVERRPTLTIYTQYRGRDIPLVRWNTTIGGWHPERMPGGGIALRYKNSPPGDRVWRDVVASPAWLPPDSTPPDDLVRRRPGGGWAPNTDLFGPGYQSAYGLVMMVHHVPGRTAEGEERFWDQRIRTHGSVSYSSILRGYSHGCHRLFNHLAVRAGSFLLRHRQHVRHGVMEANYSRRFAAHGQRHDLRIDTRGYRYELTPPVPITVTEGETHGMTRPPAGGRMLPERLRAMAAAAAEGTAQ
jgi:hypothetical protein